MCNPNPPPDDDGYCAVQGTMTLTEGPTTAKYTFPPVVDSDGETALYDPPPSQQSASCGRPSTPEPPSSSHTHQANVHSAGKFECSLAGTTSAVCIESYGGSQANHEGVSTETYAGTEQPYIPITITARAVGINRIASPTTGAGVDATQTSGVDADAGAGGGTSTEDTESSGDATTSSDSETEDVSTGDAAATSQRVGWVLGGAAMVLAML